MSLPPRVRVIDVGPCDGFQTERVEIPTELRVETIERLAAAGVRTIEMVSFARSPVTSQMLDVAEVMRRAQVPAGVRRTVRVPNLTGAEHALAAGVDEIRLVLCATESSNQRSVGMTIAQSMIAFGEIAVLAKHHGVRAAGVVGVALGCPIEGHPPVDEVARIARELRERGAWAVGLADSYGMSNPLAVRQTLAAVRGGVGRDFPLWMHLHDTRGLGMANAVAAMEEGVTAFDTAFGGLGGTPVVGGASGNLSTEDFVFLCDQMGIETGVDLQAVRRLSRRVAAFLGRELPSHVLRAGTLEELIELHRDDPDPGSPVIRR